MIETNPMPPDEYGCDCSASHSASCEDEWRYSEAGNRQINPPPPCICAWCGTAHRGWGMRPHDEVTIVARVNQGDDCACSVWCDADVWYVQGHYGSSRFDTERYRFVHSEPTRRADPVCDDCVAALVASGALEPVEGRFL